MKKVLCLIFALCVIFTIASCRKEATAASNKREDQDTLFLSDMAKGISNRLLVSDSRDDSNMGAEERAAFYKECVNAELILLEKYSDVVFNDSRFNVLAHHYIEACQMQRTATENYRNSALFDSLWNGGRTIRSSLICFFYENYNLPITQEEASNYSPSTSVSYSVSGDTEFFDYLSDNDDVRLNKGDIVIKDAYGTIEFHSWDNSSSFEYCFVILNNTSYDLNSISVRCAILDEGENVLGETSAYSHVKISAGKTVNCESSISLKDFSTAKYIRIDEIDYDGDGDSVIHPVAIDESAISKYTLLITEKTMVGGDKDISAVVDEILSYRNNDIDKAQSLLKQYANDMSQEQKEKCLISIARWGCLEPAEKKIKSYLKSPRSYYRYEGSIDSPVLQEDGKYKTTVKIKYGATNSFGGEVTDEVTLYVTFKINIDKLDYTITKTELSPYDAYRYSK